MNLVIGWTIVGIWVQLALVHSAIVVLLGRPWRKPDPLAWWILTGLAVAGAVENANLAVAALVLHHLNLSATLVAYLLTAGVVDTLLVLLIRSRRWEFMKSVKAKAIVAFASTVATAGLIAAQNVIPMSPAAHGWVTVALAVLGTASTTGAVYRVPNAPAEPKP